MAELIKTCGEKLLELARNYWWSWQPEVVSIFRDLDPGLWHKYYHNPVRMLLDFNPEQLEERARMSVLNSRVNYAYRRWREYMENTTTTWGSLHAGVLCQHPVAYFSAEYGIHESLPNYSGGLGVLAGDHLKSASDLGIPLVAIGLFYYEGYFSQEIDADGWQRETYEHAEYGKLPIRLARLPDGERVLVKVETRNGPIYAQAWEVAVGRVRLFLLDVNIEENKPEDRALTARLYGGDQRTRIRQEIVLGIGGSRVLSAMGFRPRTVHMNEGHSAFAPLELIRLGMKEDGYSFDESLRRTAAMCCFTTHTPVPAGHDRFDYGLMDEHLGPIADELGIGTEGLMGLGRVEPHNHQEPFCMTVLAFHCSRRANAVSNLHGVVSRQMWASLWPARAADEIPIGHITNGVHVGSWLAPQMGLLYDRVLAPNWSKKPGQAEVWKGISEVSDGEFWETHCALKIGLIHYARVKAESRAVRLGLPSPHLHGQILDPTALTIGFARRFAPYKRADLLLRDLDLLARIVSDAHRPVQLVFAGKSHPADEGGKRILQRIYRLTQDPAFRGKIVLLEDYDINLARHLVQGVDVWLNNPRRPLEASGTSGQKVVLNGGLNCSILDGWWAEAYDGKNGFAIGSGRTHAHQDVQDDRDAQDLLTTLMEEVIPLYYNRNQDDLPIEWIRAMKSSVQTLGWRFSSDRMVMDYVRVAYLAAAGGISCEMPRRV